MPADDIAQQMRQAAYYDQCHELIEKYGWMVQGVFPTEESPGQKQYKFCYTVGLTGKGLPEFIEYGLTLEIGKVILNQLAQRAVDGARLEHGTLIEFQNGFYGALLTAVNLSDLTLARRFYPIVRAFQLVFQDAAHRWPNDPEYTLQGLPLLGKFPTTLHGKEAI